MRNFGGPIERAMINAAVTQMAQYFELPLHSPAGTSDAKEVDIQAAYESALSNLLVAMSGANYIHDAARLMNFDLTMSYEKLEKGGPRWWHIDIWGKGRWKSGIGSLRKSEMVSH